MAVIKVIKKNAEIDGKPIEWNVLAITSYLGGDFQTLELKLTKTEAMLAGMLLASDENKPEVHTGNTSGERIDVKVGKKSKDEEIDDFLGLNNK